MWPYLCPVREGNTRLGSLKSRSWEHLAQQINKAGWGRGILGFWDSVLSIVLDGGLSAPLLMHVGNTRCQHDFLFWDESLLQFPVHCKALTNIGERFYLHVFREVSLWVLFPLICEQRILLMLLPWRPKQIQLKQILRYGWEKELVFSSITISNCNIHISTDFHYGRESENLVWKYAVLIRLHHKTEAERDFRLIKGVKGVMNGIFNIL